MRIVFTIVCEDVTGDPAPMDLEDTCSALADETVNHWPPFGEWPGSVVCTVRVDP